MKHVMLFEKYTKYQEKEADRLLDKMLDQGEESLTPDEIKRLKELDSLAQPDPTKQDNDKRVVRKDYTVDDIIFTLKDITSNDKIESYNGVIRFGGVTYNGYIMRDIETEQAYHYFIDNDGVQFEPTEVDLAYEFDDLMDEVFTDNEN